MNSTDHISRSPADEQTALFSVADTVAIRGPKVVNVASVKHRSPFRYPGGKTWLVPQLRTWAASFRGGIEEFIEPFAGGAIAGLSLLFDGLADRLTLVEKDTAVGAVWHVVTSGGAPELAERILAYDLTDENARDLLEADLDPDDMVTRALATIVRNRIQRGGILAPGAGIVRNGENGKGILSRWYPETLRNRLLDIHSVHERITFIAGDGIKFMKDNSGDPCKVWFIDPPYTVAGRRLYLHSDLDHAKLFQVTSTLKGGFLMSYDVAGPIYKLAEEFDFETAEIQMKNTHHSIMSELLISRNLDWFTS